MLLVLALLTARLEASGDGRVRLSYSLEIPEGVSSLGFSAFGASAIEDLSATASGESLVLSQERSGERLSGTLTLPKGARSPLGLEFQYRVHDAPIPVIIVDVEPGEARSGAFTARVELPAGTEEMVDFPSHGIRDDAGALAWELPVLPAFLSWGQPARPPASGVETPFAFWGLFAMNAAIVLLYVVWMRRAP